MCMVSLRASPVSLLSNPLCSSLACSRCSALVDYEWLKGMRPLRPKSTRCWVAVSRVDNFVVVGGSRQTKKSRKTARVRAYGTRLYGPCGAHHCPRCDLQNQKVDKLLHHCAMPSLTDRHWSPAALAVTRSITRSDTEESAVDSGNCTEATQHTGDKTVNCLACWRTDATS